MGRRRCVYSQNCITKSYIKVAGSLVWKSIKKLKRARLSRAAFVDTATKYVNIYGRRKKVVFSQHTHPKGVTLRYQGRGQTAYTRGGLGPVCQQSGASRPLPGDPSSS